MKAARPVQPRMQVAKGEVALRDRDGHHPDEAHHDRERGERAHRLTEDHEAEDRGLHRLGLGIGGADREVAEREEVDEEGGRDDLGEPAQHREEHEARVGVRPRESISLAERRHVDEGERGRVHEPAEGHARGAEGSLEVLLERRPQVLHERGGEGDRYPELHPEACLPSRSRRTAATAGFRRDRSGEGVPAAGRCNGLRAARIRRGEWLPIHRERGCGAGEGGAGKARAPAASRARAAQAPEPAGGAGGVTGIRPRRGLSRPRRSCRSRRLRRPAPPPGSSRTDRAAHRTGWR